MNILTTRFFHQTLRIQINANKLDDILKKFELRIGSNDFSIDDSVLEFDSNDWKESRVKSTNNNSFMLDGWFKLWKEM